MNGPTRIVTGTKMGAHVDPDDGDVRLDEPGGQQRALEFATATLTIESVKLGLVLDKQSIVNEGVATSMFSDDRLARYTAYAYPHGSVPQ